MPPYNKNIRARMFQFEEIETWVTSEDIIPNGSVIVTESIYCDNVNPMLFRRNLLVDIATCKSDEFDLLDLSCKTSKAWEVRLALFFIMENVLNNKFLRGFDIIELNPQDAEATNFFYAESITGVFRWSKVQSKEYLWDLEFLLTIQV